MLPILEREEASKANAIQATPPGSQEEPGSVHGSLFQRVCLVMATYCLYDLESQETGPQSNDPDDLDPFDWPGHDPGVVAVLQMVRMPVSGGRLAVRRGQADAARRIRGLDLRGGTVKGPD